MATQHSSSALPAPAASRPYRKAHTGYGKQSFADQVRPSAADFAFLPERERYVAGYVDHLPDGAAMDIKSLAKDLPLYGQMAIGTALRALAVAGHLRRVRNRVEGDGQFRWVTLTFWSRTAHDNAWWTARLEAEAAAAPDRQPGPPYAEPGPEPGPEPVVPRQRTAQPPPVRPLEADAPAAAAASPAAASPAAASPSAAAPEAAAPPAAAAAPPAAAPPAAAPPTADAPSPAYVALAELGRRDPRLALSAADCAVLEPLAALWFARGASAQYLTSALTAGLPEQVESPVGLVRRRLNDKMPPQLSTTPAPAPASATGVPGTPEPHLLVECTECGRPARVEALPDGLCKPCRTAHQAPDSPEAAPPEPQERDVAALVAGLRNLMRTP